MKYRVLVEVEADSPREAIDVADVDGFADVIVIQVRQEPFDVPSPMWDAVVGDHGYELRRLR